MQKVDLLFLRKIQIIILGLILTTISYAQPAQKLAQADSLFEIKRYTQSLDLYKEVLEEKFSSPSMLLKMSFISEGLDKPADALFYLNLYYLKTSDKAAAVKLEEMSAEYKVSGYTNTSNDFLLSMYNRFYNEIILLLVAFAAFSFSVAIYQQRKYQQRPLLAGVISILLVAGLFYLVNFSKNDSWAIVSDIESPIMSGPSSGSNLVSIAGAGHKVKILGKEDIWVKILWNDKIAFIKKNHLRSFQGYF